MAMFFFECDFDFDSVLNNDFFHGILVFVRAHQKIFTRIHITHIHEGNG